VTDDERAEKERSMSAKAKRFTSKSRAAARFVAQRGILVPVAWSTVKVEVLGVKNLKKVGKSFIVIANHSSHLDAPLILGSLPLRMSRYLAAGAAADYFFDVWWRRGLTSLFFNAFPVDRSGVNPRGVSAKVLLQKGVPLTVFPEGTRAKDYRKLGHFKPGAAALASATGVPIVPVALVGAGRAHPRGGKWPKPGRLAVGVVYGEPMYARDGEVPTAFMARVKEQIVAMIAEHGPRILGSDYRAPEAPEGKQS
jgi:1-acyl-sn-glycerol-3-phosphate acyltransferase